jgi:hypothetical protein
MIGYPILSDLLVATSLWYRMDQLDAKAVNDTQQSGRGQEVVGPVLVGLEEPKQSGAMGQVGEQGEKVPGQPAIESPVAYSFDGMEHSDGDQFARPQQSLRMFGTFLIWSSTWQNNSVIKSWVVMRFSLIGFVTNTLREPHDFFNFFLN